MTFGFGAVAGFIAIFAVISTASAQNSPCPFDPQTLQFVGTPAEQARCLLRPNKIGGELGPAIAKLPKPLEKLIGQKVAFGKSTLRKYLEERSIEEEAMGGSLDEQLATAKLPGGTEVHAPYFIIHDTSSPYLKDETFPPSFDTDKTWRGNNLKTWIDQPVAHVFVNRLGESITTTPFSEPVRKGYGTKFARDYLKADAKVLQLHVELVQPRRRDSSNANPTNDRIAPSPGFTDSQYQKLALLYVCASIRRGTWLIPAYHAAVDAGIKDAHDDPQNFELEKFAKSVSRLAKKLD